ncbi:response regulator transcription factor [Cryobacterium sp. Y29]|uniref:helix-turn-helix transcriptional regulator n=1 Tax=Cryobacterium sp. Y29 TaxID=2048285 RepID=UPI000CE3DF8F|nr:response regulator transcription factor [Cryobacterium sp. Y29]
MDAVYNRNIWESGGDGSTVRSVAIVDDHEVVALAMAALITAAAGLVFAGSASTVAALHLSGIGADLVILDLSLRDGSTVTQNVAALGRRNAAVLCLTSGENPYLIREAARSDVLGIIRKSAPAEQIMAAIHAAAAGHPVVTSDWASVLDTDVELGAAHLTIREQEILSLYASGFGSKMVAAELGISENTVNDHIRRIRRTYGLLGRQAHTKVDLYRRGVEDGYLPLPTDT